MRSAIAPLRLQGFGFLLAARVVNELGYWLASVALAVLVFDETGSALATTALFVAIDWLPAFIAPALVARMELSRARVVLPLLYAAEGVVIAAIALSAPNFLLPVVLLLAALDGTIALAARALTRATAAAVLKPAGQLREGNALLNVGLTIGAAASPALAGVLIAVSSTRTALLAAAALLVVQSFILAAARTLPRAATELEEGDTLSWRVRLRNGLGYVKARPVLRRLFGAQALLFVFFAAVIPVEIVYAKETLDAGDAGYGALLTSWGVGMVAGSLVFAGARRLPLWLLLLASTLAVAVSYLGMGVAPSLVVACGAAVIGGVANGIQWVALMSAVQELTAATYQARVIGLLESLNAGLTGAGFVLGGLVATLFSPRLAFVVGAAGILAVVAVAAPLLARVGWAGERGDPPEDGLALAPIDRGAPADTFVAP